MAWLETLLIQQFALFTLILGRISGLVIAAPLFSSLGLPMQVRALLAVALSLLIAPLQAGRTLPQMNWDLLHYAHLLTNEVLVGVLLGLGVTILLSGVQLAGQIVSQLSGLSLADVFDPTLDSESSAFTQLFYFLALAAFVAMGGHRLVMQALLDTFVWAPPGQTMLGEGFVDAVATVLTQSYRLGIRAAAPAMIALLLSTLVLGLIGRTLPQINIIAVGFSVNSLVTLGILFLTIGTVVWVFQDPLIATLEHLQEEVQYTPR